MGWVGMKGAGKGKGKGDKGDSNRTKRIEGKGWRGGGVRDIWVRRPVWAGRGAG
jgi:hypothetical protein